MKSPRLRIPAAALALALGTVSAAADPVPTAIPPLVLPPPAALPPPSVLAPYRFATPAGAPATPLEQQKALAYRQQLQQQLDALDRSQPADPEIQRRIQGFQAERGRIDPLTGQ